MIYKYSFYFILLIMLTSVSCNKVKIRTTKVYNITDISHDYAQVETETEVLKKDNLYGGLCWGLNVNPTKLDNLIDERQFMGSDLYKDEYFMLKQLIPGSQYHVRSFLDTPEGVLYSEDAVFGTLPLPDAPCVTIPGQVDFVYFTEDATNLTIATEGYYGVDDFAYVSTCSYGTFRVFFNELPVTGIYKTVFYGDVDNNSQIAIDFRGGNYNCYYQTAIHKDVYVQNDNGQFSVRFCNLDIGTATGLCNSYFVLSGELHN